MLLPRIRLHPAEAGHPSRGPTRPPAASAEPGLGLCHQPRGSKARTCTSGYFTTRLHRLSATSLPAQLPSIYKQIPDSARGGRGRGRPSRPCLPVTCASRSPPGVKPSRMHHRPGTELSRTLSVDGDKLIRKKATARTATVLVPITRLATTCLDPEKQSWWSHCPIQTPPCLEPGALSIVTQMHGT